MFRDRGPESHLCRVFVFGLQGVGKSHLLLLFALSRMRARVEMPTSPRVLYLPSAHLLASRELLFSACRACYYDCEHSLAQLNSMRSSLRDLLLFLQQDENLLLVVDQCNVLQGRSGDHADAARDALENFRWLVFAASPQQESVSILMRKEDLTLKFIVPPLSVLSELKACIAPQLSTLSAHGHELSEEQWRMVEAVTGNVPLQCKVLLDGCLENITKSNWFNIAFEAFVANRSQSVWELLEHRMKLDTLSVDVLEHLAYTSASVGSAGYVRTLLEVQAFPWTDVSVTFVSSKGVHPHSQLRPSCELVRSVFERFHSNLLLDEKVQNIKRRVDNIRSQLLETRDRNPCVAGFLLESILLSMLQFPSAQPGVATLLWRVIRDGLANPTSFVGREEDVAEPVSLSSVSSEDLHAVQLGVSEVMLERTGSLARPSEGIQA